MSLFQLYRIGGRIALKYLLLYYYRYISTNDLPTLRFHGLVSGGGTQFFVSGGGTSHPGGTTTDSMGTKFSVTSSNATKTCLAKFGIYINFGF